MSSSSSPSFSSTSLPSSSSSLSHLQTIFDLSTCLKRGLCPVTKLRPQGSELLESHSLYYEIHGTTPASENARKVVFIMGLNSSSFAWGPQIRHFGKKEGYKSLVFDNRGVGHSGYPRGPYTTSAMAEDVICLLDTLGWTGTRELHVVGISLGGMIAQELASRIPQRIASLTLAVTTPGGRPWNNFPPWAGLKTLTRLVFIADPAKKVPLVMDMLYPSKWLAEHDEDDPQGRTNREVQSESFLRRVLITKPQELMGHISQMAAALTHHVSPARLAAISKSIPKVVIITGDEDNLVLPSHSLELKASMPEAELIQWQGTGHAINSQRVKEFNALLEQTFEEGRQKAESFDMD